MKTTRLISILLAAVVAGGAYADEAAALAKLGKKKETGAIVFGTLVAQAPPRESLSITN